LEVAEEEMIMDLSKKNDYLFAWKPLDMLGIDESIITHKLSFLPSIKPVGSGLDKDERG